MYSLALVSLAPIALSIRHHTEGYNNYVYSTTSQKHLYASL
jgi:hypothetical protein